MLVVYLAGKYNGDTDRNIAEARKVACDLWIHGYAVICPHLNTDHFEVDCSCVYEDYMEGDLEILSRCDMVVTLPDWQESPGATREVCRARFLNIPVLEY